MPEMDVDGVLRARDGFGGGDEAAGALPDRRQPPPPAEDPYLPPESFQVPIGEEGIDWTDLNAVFDRDDSTKGSTNPKSSHANTKSRSISERSSAGLKANPPVIGLASAIRTSGFPGRASRRQPTGRIVPKKGARSGGGSAAEPGSPKVSCFGKVLSDRERGRNQKHGPWRRRWTSCFRCRGGGAAGEGEGRSGSQPSPANEAGLGAMKRFASGRRAASWGEEAEGQARRRHPKREEEEEAAAVVEEVEHNGGGGGVG